MWFVDSVPHKTGSLHLIVVGERQGGREMKGQLVGNLVAEKTEKNFLPVAAAKAK